MTLSVPHSVSQSVSMCDYYINYQIIGQINIQDFVAGHEKLDDTLDAIVSESVVRKADAFCNEIIQ
jgi:hypothetical protein